MTLTNKRLGSLFPNLDNEQKCITIPLVSQRESSQIGSLFPENDTSENVLEHFKRNKLNANVDVYFVVDGE